MKRKWLAVGIILLFVGVTTAPTINFNTVKASQQNIVEERINQRELLFQTIVDIANNKEIQRVILKSQMSRGIFPPSEFSIITKSQLKMIYFLGLILSKVISTSKMQSIVGKYQFSNQEIRKEINGVIKKDATLNAEISQLQDSECDCGNEKTTRLWDFRFICFFILFPLYIIIRAIEIHLPIYLPVVIMLIIGSFFHCFWAYWPLMR